MSMKDYATRAFQSNDQRFARVFEKLGYSRSDMTADPLIEIISKQYESVFGRKPRASWDVEKIQAKLDAKLREEFEAAEVPEPAADIEEVEEDQ